MTKLKGNSLQYLNIVYRFTILYFVLIVAKFKLFPSIINSYFEFEIQLINDLGIGYKIALFSVFCGFAHTTLRYLIQNILIKKIQINLIDIMLICFLFYTLKFFNFSRILLFSTIIISTLINYYLKNNNKKLNTIYTIIFLSSIYIFQIENINSNETTTSLNVSVSIEDQVTYVENLDLEVCLNTFSTISYEEKQNISSKNNVYVIGHAYGSHSGNNLGLSNSVLNFFKSLTIDNQILILTGDIVRESSLENLELVQNQISTYFDEYYIAVGNHDIDAGRSNNFYKVFGSDLNFINLNSTDMIVANFSTFNWKPALADQVRINSFIEQSINETIIIFSHQVFWYNLTVNEPKLNGKVTLKEDLGLDTLDWLETNGKNVIVIRVIAELVFQRHFVNMIK